MVADDETAGSQRSRRRRSNTPEHPEHPPTGGAVAAGAALGAVTAAMMSKGDGRIGAALAGAAVGAPGGALVAPAMDRGHRDQEATIMERSAGLEPIEQFDPYQPTPPD